MVTSHRFKHCVELERMKVTCDIKTNSISMLREKVISQRSTETGDIHLCEKTTPIANTATFLNCNDASHLINKYVQT